MAFLYLLFHSIFSLHGYDSWEFKDKKYFFCKDCDFGHDENTRIVKNIRNGKYDK